MSIKQKRSGFEKRMGDVLEPAGFLYEPCSTSYSVPHVYTPDFVLEDVWVECKGWFRPGDRLKYKTIAKSLMFAELVFLLQSPLKKVSKGAKLTMSGWCNKEGIRWFSTPEEVIAYVTDR
jgi:hypothetical protein